jgi:hypothetical protein
MVADMTFEQQMLAAHIQQADPIMHDIIEKVGPPSTPFRRPTRYGVLTNSGRRE